MNNEKEKYIKVIKLLLKTVIKSEKELYKFASVLNKKQRAFTINAEPKEIIPFSELEELLELESKNKCEKMYEDIGNMLEKNVDLDVEIDKFIKEYF